MRKLLRRLVGSWRLGDEDNPLPADDPLSTARQAYADAKADAALAQQAAGAKTAAKIVSLIDTDLGTMPPGSRQGRDEHGVFVTYLGVRLYTDGQHLSHYYVQKWHGAYDTVGRETWYFPVRSLADVGCILAGEHKARSHRIA